MEFKKELNESPSDLLQIESHFAQLTRYGGYPDPRIGLIVSHLAAINDDLAHARCRSLYLPRLKRVHELLWDIGTNPVA